MIVLEVKKLCDAKELLLGKRVVIFDLDDTLYPEKGYVKSGYAAIARHHSEIPDMAQKLFEAFEGGKQAINHVLENEGIFSEQAVKECLDIYRNHQPDITLYTDAKALLEALCKSGVRLGMITDGRPEGQRAKIKALGIEKYFEKIIITDELGGVEYRKPNTAAFEKMQSFFDVPYEDMVYVGDNPKKDFIAPTLLGMESVYFKNSDGLYSN